jgi:hypothetical protein
MPVISAFFDFARSICANDVQFRQHRLSSTCVVVPHRQEQPDMSESFRQESAKIYEFPGKIRAAASARRRDDKTADILRLQQAPVVEFGSGWYHEAAVQEAERPRKP